MRSLAKYAYLNAFLRARLSARLDEGFLSSLARAADLPEAAGLLRNTEYRPVAEAIDGGATLQRAEKILIEIEIGRSRAILRHATGDVAGFVSALMELYDVGKVERIIRIWKEKAWDDRDGIIAEKICHDIPTEAMLKASSIEELILLLEDTPFRKPLVSAYEQYRRSGKIFFLEASLETDYYRRLWEAVKRLGRADRLVASRILGTEVDIRNVEILLRLTRYSDFPAAEARRVLLPGGFHLRDDLLLRAYSAKDTRAFIDALRSVLLSSVGALNSAGEALEQMRILGMILEGALAAEALRALAGFPFTIGTVIAYLSLSRAESRQVRRILVGKSLGLAAEKILQAAGT
jgi:V/A-type H+-transporting ATPase subunit C